MNADYFKSSINGHLDYYGKKIGREPFYPRSGQEIIEFLDDFIKAYNDAKSFKSELKIYLEENYAQVMEEDMTLRAKSKDRDHEPWLTEDKKVWKNKIYTNSQFAYYKHHFQKSHGPMIASDLDESTDAILTDMENPNRSGNWETKGMVVGDVQSGKTANYAGLIAKAIDAGYKLIIVMSGIYNSLRSQTQERLMNNLISTSNDFGSGVFKVNFMTQKPTFKTQNGIQVMDTNGDFNASTAKTVGLYPNLDPAVFVIKKNVSVLSNILIWLNAQEGIKKEINKPWTWNGYREFIRDKLPEHQLLSDLPLLLIDDECDSASIDISRRQTSGQLSGLDEDEIEQFRQADPSKTNQLIRRILSSFKKNSYIGYTATPLANIFIDYTSIKKQEGRDLFPRDFIKILKRYDKYQSPLSIFGQAERNFEDDNEVVSLSENIDEEKYPQVKWIYDNRDDHQDFPDDKKRDEVYREESHPRAEVPLGWMPLYHKDDHSCLYKDEDDIPPSLKDAVRSFLIICVLRKIRKNKNPHNSMLVHVSRFIKIQQKVQIQISNFIKKIRQTIQNEIDESKIELIKDEFKKIWEKDVEANLDISKNFEKKKISFDEIWTKVKELLSDEQNFEVIIINSKSTDNLNYSKQPEGWNVIVIGGAAISRGITLEGLSISYFLRIAKTPVSDTLIQMGRWFGYREGYEDLFRIYCPKILHILFRQFTYAMEFARAKFAEMQGGGGEESKTPTDYAMEIPSFEGWKLISAAKAKDTQVFHEPLFSYTSKHHQNILYFKNEQHIKKNFELTNKLLEKMGSYELETADLINKRMKAGSFWTAKPMKEKIDHELEYDEIIKKIPKKTNLKVNNVNLWREIDPNDLTEYLANYKQPRRSFSDSFAPDIAYKLFELNKQKKDLKWNLALWSINGNEASKRTDFENIKNHILIDRGLFKNYNDHFSLRTLADPTAEFMDIEKEVFDEGVKSWIEVYKRTGKTENKKTNMLPFGFRGKIRQKRKEGLFILYPFTLSEPDYKEDEVHIGWQIIIPSTRHEGDGEGELIYSVALNRVAYEHRKQNFIELNQLR